MSKNQNPNKCKYRSPNRHFFALGGTSGATIILSWKHKLPVFIDQNEILFKSASLILKMYASLRENVGYKTT